MWIKWKGAVRCQFHGVVFSDDASTMYVEEADTSGSATNPWVRIERFLVCQAERMDEVRLAF